MLRNNASGPEIKLPGRKSSIWAGRRADFDAFPTAPLAVPPKGIDIGHYPEMFITCVFGAPCYAIVLPG